MPKSVPAFEWSGEYRVGALVENVTFAADKIIVTHTIVGADLESSETISLTPELQEKLARYWQDRLERIMMQVLTGGLCHPVREDSAFPRADMPPIIPSGKRSWGPVVTGE